MSQSDFTSQKRFTNYIKNPSSNQSAKVQDAQLADLRSLQPRLPIQLSSFNGNEEKASQFYSEEISKLRFANDVLRKQLDAAIAQKNQLAEMIGQSGGKEKIAAALTSFNLVQASNSSNEEPKRRHRRYANQIERKWICPVEKCERSYGSEGSLSQHLKLKHPGLADDGFDVKLEKQES